MAMYKFTEIELFLIDGEAKMEPFGPFNIARPFAFASDLFNELTIRREEINPNRSVIIKINSLIRTFFYLTGSGQDQIFLISNGEEITAPTNANSQLD